MSDPDEEGLITALAIENGEVLIFWPHREDAPVLRFDPDSADQFADAVKEKAQEARDLSK
jgi:hypothetical protein